MPSNNLQNNNPNIPSDPLPYYDAFEYYPPEINPLPYYNAFGYYLPETEINKIYNIVTLKVAKYILLIPYEIARFTNHNTIALIMKAGHMALDCTGNFYRFKYSMETLNSYLKYFSMYEEYIEPKIAVLVSLVYKPYDIIYSLSSFTYDKALNSYLKYFSPYEEYLKPKIITLVSLVNKPYDIAENLVYSLSSFTYNKIFEPIIDRLYSLIYYKDIQPCFEITNNKTQQVFFTQNKEHEGFIVLNIDSLPDNHKLCIDSHGKHSWAQALNYYSRYTLPEAFLIDINKNIKTSLYFGKCPEHTQEFYDFLSDEYANESKEDQCWAKYAIKYAITPEAYKQCFGDTAHSYSTSSAYKAERECLNSPEGVDVFSTPFLITNTHDEL